MKPLPIDDCPDKKTSQKTLVLTSATPRTQRKDFHPSPQKQSSVCPDNQIFQQPYLWPSSPRTLRNPFLLFLSPPEWHLSQWWLTRLRKKWRSWRIYIFGHTFISPLSTFPLAPHLYRGWQWVVNHLLKGLAMLWALVSVATKHVSPKPGILPKQQELIPEWGWGLGWGSVFPGYKCVCVSKLTPPSKCLIVCSAFKIKLDKKFLPSLRKQNKNCKQNVKLSVILFS